MKIERCFNSTRQRYKRTMKGISGLMPLERVGNQQDALGRCSNSQENHLLYMYTRLSYNRNTIHDHVTKLMLLYMQRRCWRP